MNIYIQSKFTYIYICVHIYVNMHMYIYITRHETIGNAFWQARVVTVCEAEQKNFLSIHLYTYTYTYTYTHTHTHTHTHTYIHTYTHMTQQSIKQTENTFWQGSGSSRGRAGGVSLHRLSSWDRSGMYVFVCTQYVCVCVSAYIHVLSLLYICVSIYYTREGISFLCCCAYICNVYIM